MDFEGISPEFMFGRKYRVRVDFLPDFEGYVTNGSIWVEVYRSGWIFIRFNSIIHI